MADLIDYLLINNVFLMTFFMHDDISFLFFNDIFNDNFDIIFHNLNNVGIPLLLKQNISLSIDVYFDFINEDLIPSFYNVLPLDVWHLSEEIRLQTSFAFYLSLYDEELEYLYISQIVFDLFFNINSSVFISYIKEVESLYWQVRMDSFYFYEIFELLRDSLCFAYLYEFTTYYINCYFNYIPFELIKPKGIFYGPLKSLFFSFDNPYIYNFNYIPCQIDSTYIYFDILYIFEFLGLIEIYNIITIFSVLDIIYKEYEINGFFYLFIIFFFFNLFILYNLFKLLIFIIFIYYNQKFYWISFYLKFWLPKTIPLTFFGKMYLFLYNIRSFHQNIIINRFYTKSIWRFLRKPKIIKIRSANLLGSWKYIYSLFWIVYQIWVNDTLYFKLKYIIWKKFNILFFQYNNIITKYHNMKKKRYVKINYFIHLNTIKNYFWLYLPFFIRRVKKLIYFFFFFFIKFIFYKIIKFIIYFNFFNNKYIYIFIYYLYNIFIIIKYFINIFTHKFIVYLYWKVKLNKLIFINLTLNFFIYKFIASFFYKKFYYINPELYDHFPSYQSNFALNFFKFTIPLEFKNNTHKYLYINISLFYLKLFNIILNNISFIVFNCLLFFFCFNYNINIFFIFLNCVIFYFYIINFYDYKFYNKFIFNIIKFFFFNNFKILKNFFFSILSILTHIIKSKIILLNYIFNILWFFFIFLIYIIIYFLYYHINIDNINLYYLYFIFLYTFYSIIINLTNYNFFIFKFLVNFGYYCCLIIDIFKHFSKKMFSLFYKLFLYFFFYPFIFFLFIFILYNNNLLLYNFFYNLLQQIIIHIDNNFIIIYNIIESYFNKFYFNLSPLYSQTISPWIFPQIDQVYIDRYIMPFNKSHSLLRWIDVNFYNIPSDIIYKHPFPFYYHVHKFSKNLLLHSPLKIKFDFVDIHENIPYYNVFYWEEENFFLQYFFLKTYFFRKFLFLYNFSPSYNKLYLIDYNKNSWLYNLIDFFYNIKNFNYPKKFTNYYKLHNNTIDYFNLQLDIFICKPINIFINNYKNIITKNYQFYNDLKNNFSNLNRDSIKYWIEKKFNIFKDIYIYNNIFGFIFNSFRYLKHEIINNFTIFYYIIIDILKAILYIIVYYILYYIYYLYIHSTYYIFFCFLKFNIFNFYLNILKILLDYVYITIWINIFEYIYIIIPYYIIQNFLNLFLFEYFIFFIQIYLINLKIYLNILYTINNILFIYINNILFIYYLYIDNMCYYIYWFLDIFLHFFLDILYNINVSFIDKYLYCYTNMEFIFYWFYLKLYYLKDSFYSWFRFPITELNNISIIFQSDYAKYNNLYRIVLFICHKNLLAFYYYDNIDISNWIKFIEFDSLIIDYIIWSISQLDYILDFEYFDETMLSWYFFFNTDFWNILWLCFFLFLYIYIIIIFIIYTYLYSNLKLDILNYNNNFNWDILREDTINNNFNWFVKHKTLQNCYIEESMLINLFKLKPKKWKKIKKQLELSFNKLIKEQNLTEEELEKKKKELKNKIKKLKISFKLLKNYKKKKKEYLYYYMEFLNYKKKWLDLYYNLINFITDYKFLKIYKIFKLSKKSKKKNKKNLKYFQIFIKKFENIYKNFNKKLHFNFKNIIINNKFHYLNNISLLEINRFDLFLRFYYKFNFSIESVLNNYFEEEYFTGPMSIFMFKRDYKYLSNKIYNLYYYYKWIDSFFLFNKGSIFFFHKDPTMVYISYDNKYNTHIINNGEEYNIYKFFFCFLFFMLPLTLYFNIITYFILYLNTINDMFLDSFQLELIYWLTWLLMQFESLNIIFIKIIFSTLCNIFVSTDQAFLNELYINNNDSIFTEYYSNKFFPLYQYFCIKYFNIEELNLLEYYDNTTSFLDNFKLHNIYLYFIENIYLFYDILFIKFLKIDTYSYIIIFYNIFRFILFIFLVLVLFFNKNNTKLFIFFNYIKINFNYYNFSNKIINNITKFKSKFFNKFYE